MFPAKFPKRVRVVDMDADVLSASPLIFDHEIVKIYLLNHWSVFDCMCPDPQARKRGVIMSGHNAFSLKLLPDLPLRIEQVSKNASGQEGPRS